MPNQPIDPAKDQLLDAILPYVAFDGWSASAFDAAVAEVGIAPAHAKTLCPRGAVDLAIAYHKRGDLGMIKALADADLRDMRFRDKVAHAVGLRIAAVDDKEAVRRGSTLFAMPHMAADGAKLIWGTADAIWDALGDTSRDGNWYSKRLILSGVYSSTVLYWLGDDSLDGQATTAFIERRIDDVMQFEKVKASVNKNPLLKPITGPLGRLMSQIKAPSKIPQVDLPGMCKDPE
ncbi:COQ9 family protein [Yoonia sp. SS1-5]|uniref:COQ9 family protein n=1 Tax=Yoonia rhodophyticola TaxID=3137370 RepID=A0AAN0MHJ1_9RHOB